MKLSNLMLSASVAAMALVSCNKQDTTPEIAKRLKTVEVSLDNIVLTKGEAGNKIESGDAVFVKDFQVFLTDGSGNSYEAKVADGSKDAETYWDSEDLSSAALEASFHYVDPNCTKVVAVANVGKKLTFAEYQALSALEIGTQQKQDALMLFDVKDLSPAGKQHNDENVDGTTYVSDVYEAALVLTPRVSRFEVDGFTVKFNADPKYNEIRVTQLAFQNYYPATSLVTGEESGALVNHIANLADQAEVYAWLDDPEKPAEWYRDYFDITLTPPTSADPYANVKDTPKPLAYHAFSCDETPVLVIKLLADNQPAYLYSKGFYAANGTPVTEFEEGKIYRMSAKGEVENDGSIAIDEDDIDPMDRCLEITVDVVDWVVELVYPEF